MFRKAYGALAAAAVAAAFLGAAGCSAGARSGATMLPNAGGAAAIAPQAKPTPPVTAPVRIPYPYTNTYTTTTWSSAHAAPKRTTGSDTGTTTVKFVRDKKTGIYLVPETIVSNLGYKEVLNSAVGFLRLPSGGIAQVILSDNYTYTQGKFRETGMDTYPQGEAAPDFPLTTGRTWSGAANHTSFYNEVLTGAGAFEENVSSNVSSNGTYTGQTSFSSTKGVANQDNYASTTNVTLNGSSTYTLAEPARRYNLLTQVFSPPNGHKQTVTTYGVEPLPYKPGTVVLPSWYNLTTLNNVFYADNWQVIGPATMPSDCGSRTGQAATEVDETSYDVDPVQGTNNDYTAKYYMASLATGQYWFACIVENYTNTTFANGWVMGAGHWGTPSSRQVGKEVLIAQGATPPARALAGVHGLQALSFITPVRMRAQVARLGLRSRAR
jgi:hypothetical protein